MNRHSKVIGTTLALLCLFYLPSEASGFKFTKQSLDSVVQRGSRTSRGVLVGKLSIDSDTIYIDSSGTNMIFNDGSNTNVTLSSLASGGAPTDATYITQTANGTLTNEQALTSLTSGVLSSDSATGVLSTRTISGTANEVDVSSTSSSITVGIVDPLIVGKGGTGAASQTDGGVLIGKGTSPFENTGLLGKGTLIVGDGVTNPTTLTVGSNGQVLSADSSTASGLKWVTLDAASGGTPAGSTGQIQFNNGGSFGGASLVSTDTSGLRLGIGPGVSSTVSLDVAGSFRTVPFQLTDGSSIALDASRSNFFYVTLAGAPRTLSNPTNSVFGQRIILLVSQDAAGSRKMGFGTAYKFGYDVPSYDASTTAGHKDYIGIVCSNPTTPSWDIVSVSRGYK